MKKYCPNSPDHKLFVASVEVHQLWVIDENGEFVESLNDCLNVIRGPDPEMYWECLECGSEAEKPELRLVTKEP